MKGSRAKKNGIIGFQNSEFQARSDAMLEIQGFCKVTSGGKNAGLFQKVM